MGIELQSAPHGHHKVSGMQGHANKAGDASQSDGAFGFAAMMDLMSGSESDVASAQDASGTALPSSGLTGVSAVLDANATLAAVQPADSAAVFVLPTGAQPAATCTPQFACHDVNLLGSRVSALRTMQPGVDSTAGASVGLTDTATSPGVGQPRGGFPSSSDMSDGLDPSSQTLNLPTGTVMGSALSSVVVRVAQGEGQPKGFQTDTTGMKLMGDPTLPSAVGQGLLGQSKGDPNRATGRSALTVPAVQVDAQLPAPMPVQTEQTSVKASPLAATQSKAGVAAEQVIESMAPNGQAQTLTMAQTSAQAMVPMSSEQLAQAATLKPGGMWTSQQSTPAGQLRQDPGDLTTVASNAAGLGSTNSLVPTLALNPQDAGIRLSDRPAKHLTNRFGSGGEGVYGQPMATINPADALFQVAPTSAASASTVVAETVSYWASQGVQNASLQLDGFGDETVEVRISVNGDSAQVDFRTNQPEVRQAIEGAASQLKDMLSSQGMQLAGLSIGTSGRGGAQDKNTKPSSDVRKVGLVKSEVVEATRTRGANPSVGQSLDLFV
jgi:flagellar hook-length control protein FliK